MAIRRNRASEIDMVEHVIAVQCVGEDVNRTGNALGATVALWLKFGADVAALARRKTDTVYAIGRVSIQIDQRPIRRGVDLGVRQRLIAHVLSVNDFGLSVLRTPQFVDAKYSTGTGVCDGDWLIFTICGTLVYGSET